MSKIRLETDREENGCRLLRLENDRIIVDVLPELGGKIYRFVYKHDNRDYLWQHPQIQPDAHLPGTNYDDSWAGGWDELFPSAAPCQHAGKTYPDHGELWTQPFEWDVDQSADSLTLHLRAEGTVTTTRMERSITLDESSAALRFNHRITHLGAEGFDFLWSLHPALAVGPTHEYLIPARSGIIASPGMGRLPAEPCRFDWPDVPGRGGNTIDFSQVPTSPVTPGYEMLHLTELSAGWFAVRDRASHSGFGMAFDKSLFDTIWLFHSHGGWRGLHVAVIEPCTGYPDDLAQAAATGQCARLEPGQQLETRTTAVIFTNQDRIQNIDLDGAVS